MKKSREKQLLIHCARTHMDEERIREVRDLLEGGDLDWNYILENRSAYRIMPLLFRNLKEIAVENAVPQSVMDNLAARYVLTLYQNMQICDQLQEVLDKLNDEGIPVILLKGIALAQIVYPDIALRPMADIDLLAKKADLPVIAEVLLGLGYAPLLPIEPFKEFHHMVPYGKADRNLDGNIPIEIHHNIVSKPLMSRIKPDHLWENGQRVNLAGIDVSVLSPENLILHLCLHLADDCFIDGMRILVDISESIRFYGSDLDWDSIVAKSNQFGVGSSVYYPLSLAKETMDAGVPTHVLSALKLDPELKPFEVGLLRRIITRNILRTYSDSFFPSRLVTCASRSPCEELLFTSGMSSRVRNIGSTWIRNVNRVPHI